MGEKYKDIDKTFVLDTTGHLKLSYGNSVINDSIISILSTNIGERVMNPTFGSTLKDFLFEPMTIGTTFKMQVEIESAITRFEDRILLENVSISPNYERNYYTIVVNYQIYTTSERGSFEGKLKKL